MSQFPSPAKPTGLLQLYHNHLAENRVCGLVRVRVHAGRRLLPLARGLVLEDLVVVILRGHSSRAPRRRFPHVSTWLLVGCGASVEGPK
jgi:hypothetical protein